MPNSPWGYDSDGFVEDSEPEREELRRKEKEEKKKTKGLTTTSSESMAISGTKSAYRSRVSVTNSVISISGKYFRLKYSSIVVN
jgi:hypothetical protein